MSALSKMKMGCLSVCKEGKHFHIKGISGSENRRGWEVQLEVDLHTVKFLFLEHVFTFLFLKCETLRSSLVSQ